MYWLNAVAGNSSVVEEEVMHSTCSFIDIDIHIYKEY